MLKHIFLSVLSTSLVTSLIIVLLVILTPLINRRYASKWKYWAWILLALRLVIPFSLSDAQELLGNLSRSLTAGTKQYERDAANLPQPKMPVRTSQRIMLELPSGVTEPLTQPDQASAHITWLMILEMIWLSGSMVLISVHLGSYLAYKRQVRIKGHRIEKRTVLKFVCDLSDELQLKKPIYAVAYYKADSPMILGFIQPFLVLPTEEYSDQELYFIMKHELVHYKRHDVWWKLLFILANAIHWFNPVIWLMQKEAVVDMELSCDERVMQDADYTVKKAYTETLFSTLHKKYTKKSSLSTQFYGGKQVMKKRFRNILSCSKKRSGLFMLICMAVLVLSLGLLIGCSVAESDHGNLSEGEQNSAYGIVMDGVDASEEGLGEVESGNTITLTYIMEGEPEEETATLYTGSGYSIYVPDDDWIRYKPDSWQSAHNEKIRFWINCFDNQNMSQVKRELGNSQGMIPDVETGRENELTQHAGDIITRVRLIEQPDASCVWAFFYCYPEDAIEGAGVRIPVIADTFRAAEIVESGFWEVMSLDGKDTNVLEFKNGLRLVLPEEWIGRVVIEKTNPTSELLEDRLTIYEKNNAEANGRGELIHLDYISHSIDGVDVPYSIYGENAHEIYRVLGVYTYEEQEYALIYAKYPKEGYDGYANVDPDDSKLQKDYQDLYTFVDEVQIITDHIVGFTECEADGLDWIYIEGID